MVIETATAMLELPTESDDWPEPERLAEALPEVMQFDLELMPESLRPLVKDVAERMQVPLDFPAIAVIATLAGITNRRAIMQPKRNDSGWKVVPNLWGGIVASPGMLKSPVISNITQPAREIESEWRRTYNAAFQIYLAAQEIDAEEVKAWKAQFQSAAKKKTERPSKPSTNLLEPSLRRLITSDATFEMLQKLLSENPAGLFVVRDELTGWLALKDTAARVRELFIWSAGTATNPSRLIVSVEAAFTSPTLASRCLVVSSQHGCGRT